MAANADYRAYVDGSWIDGRIGYGAVVLHGEAPVMEFSGAVPTDYAAGTRQVAGELVAAGKVIAWCKANGIREIEVYHDYIGVAAWPEGTWKANQPLTQRYAKFVRESNVRVHFIKVKAHSGDRWNDYADALAKRGAGQGRPSVADAEQASPSDPAAEEAPFNALGIRIEEGLIQAGHHVQFLQAYNNQYVRLAVLDAKGRKLGLLDVYNTPKKPLHPRAHAFKNETAQRRILVAFDALRPQLLG